MTTSIMPMDQINRVKEINQTIQDLKQERTKQILGIRRTFKVMHQAGEITDDFLAKSKLIDWMRL